MHRHSQRPNSIHDTTFEEEPDVHNQEQSLHSIQLENNHSAQRNISDTSTATTSSDTSREHVNKVQPVNLKDSSPYHDSAYGSREISPERPLLAPGHSVHNIHRLNEEDSTSAPTAKAQLKPDKPVAWRDLPKKKQLAVLTLARLAEPIAGTSLSSYMYFMLESFDPSLSSATISTQAGILVAAFTAAQCLTAVIWGRLADKETIGRKNVLLVGLIGTLISVVGFGFSKSFYTAMFFRILGGALNGNVGVMRTMVSEMIVQKKYQAKAFLIMPVTFNVGIIVGPLLGGWLQDPTHTLAVLFGPGSAIGGQRGIHWLQVFPYALPNLVTATFLFFSTILVILCLEETHIDRRHRHDYGLQVGKWIYGLLKRITCRSKTHNYLPIGDEPDDLEMNPSPTQQRPQKSSTVPVPRAKLQFRRMWTRNVVITYITHGLLAMHLGAFNNLLFLFLSTPRFDPRHPSPEFHTAQKLPFGFTGGLGLSPPTIGAALGILGVVGLTLQFAAYSRITHHLGIIKSYRYSLILFPLTYALSPYLAMIPTSSLPPHAADGPWIWMAICLLMINQVVGRTFSLPCTQILVNNCTPHPSILGTVHGFGQTVSAGGRTIGPILWSFLYGLGLKKGVVGLAWWILSIEAILATITSRFQYEGSGHEIKLEGENGDD